MSTTNVYKLLEEYSDQTVIHGFRYIFKSTNLFWRILWVAMFTAAWSAFTWQVVERTRKYYSKPINVAMEVEHSDPVPFPVITLCNSNTYRITESERLGLWNNITKFYNHKSTDRHKFDYLDYVNYTTLIGLAHKKEDMIKECVWEGEHCGPENFTGIMTDNGYCYSFNFEKSGRIVHDTGVLNGLRLLLNVESYDHMAGPHSSAGFNIMIHTLRNMPRVRDLSISLAQENDVKIGLQLSRIKELPYPDGNCGEKEPIGGHSVYSDEYCYTDCNIGSLIEKCGCKPWWIQWKPNVPFCNMSTHSGCVESALRDLNSNDTCFKYEICPTDCIEDTYLHDISYTKRSFFATNKLATRWADDKAMFEQHKHAMLTLHRQEEKFWKENDKDILHTLEELNTTHVEFQETVTKLGELVAAFMGSTVREVEQSLRDVIKQQADFIVHFDKNLDFDELVSVLDASLSQFRKNLDLMYNKYVIKIVRLKRENVSGDAEKRRMVTLQHIVEINLRRLQTSCEILEQLAREKIELYEKYEQKVIRNDTGDLASQVPKKYLNDWKRGVVAQLHLLSLYVNKTVAGIDRILEILDRIVQDESSKTSTLDKRISIIEEKLMSVKTSGDHFMIYAALARKYLTAVFRKVKIDQVVKKDFFADYTARKQNVLTQLKQLEVHVKKVLRGTGVKEKMKRLHYFIESWKNTTKLDLLECLENLHQKFVIKLDGSDFAIGSRFAAVIRSAHDFITETNLQTVTLEGSQGSTATLADQFKGMVSNLKMKVDAFDESQQRTSNAWKKFTTNFHIFRGKLKSFNESLTINRAFIRNNFMNVWVYFQKLSYQTVRKQEGYKWFALLSDIGGAAGLFLGASVLVIPEFIYFCVRKASERSRIRKIRQSVDLQRRQQITTIEVQPKSLQLEKTKIDLPPNRAPPQRIDALWQIA